MRILVIGGYSADKLQSMNRYADVLVSQYQPYGIVSHWRSPELFSRFPLVPPLVKKYLAYIDKIILFPLRLACASRSFDIFHIADHGYAYCSFCFNPSRCIVTCHDFLAVRGAMGDPAAATDASPIGIWLQRLIMAGLRRSGSVIFVSKATYLDYQLLGGGPSTQRCKILPNPFNAQFTSNYKTLELNASDIALLPSFPYLLMMGSSLRRKNRILSLKVLLCLGKATPYKLVFAGAPLTEAELLFIQTNQLDDRVLSIIRPSHQLLNFLYCKAFALLFPSFAEGFGWPIIEAQACGCPVIASTTSCIPEVAGAGALFADPSDVTSFTKHVLSLEDHDLRKEFIKKGFLNIRRYDFSLLSRQLADFAFNGTY